MRKPPRNVAIALAVAVAVAVLVLSACGADTRHERADKPDRSKGGAQREQRAEQRRFWGWTRARELEAKRIFANDPSVKPFFAHRKVTIEASGPWNDERSQRVLGGLLKVSVAKPIYGIHKIPGFTSTKRGTFKMFRVDVAGARKFHVIVSFERQRVAEVSPLLEGSPRDPG